MLPKNVKYLDYFLQFLMVVQFSVNNLKYCMRMFF